jgi:glycosyltransferase involved in cell wall biosynthesis
MSTITALILTKDEEQHIERCIRSLRGVCDDILVVDSGSRDRTCALATALGARVVSHPWKNYATQFNYGLYECDIHSDWVWRIDADEYLEGNLGAAVRQALADCPDDVNGLYVRKRIDFMGRPLLHGGWYPSYHLKVFRRGQGDCENRWMDEHIRLFSGRTLRIEEGNQVDANLNDLTWWTAKHNGYATREMLDMLLMEYGLDAQAEEVKPRLFGTEEQRKRWLKVRYVRGPLFLRPFANFTLRYLFRGGFLDGREGFIWHALQGFWYRLLVDAKIFEFKKRFRFEDDAIRTYLTDNYLTKVNRGGVKRLRNLNVAARSLAPSAERRRYAA